MATHSFTSGAVLLAGTLLVAPRDPEMPHRRFQGSAVSKQRDSTAVAGVVDLYHRSLATGDTATALRLLANDAVVLESGEVETRDEYRSSHLSADITFARAVPSERGHIVVVLQGDVGWTISTSRARGTFRGRSIDSQGAELMVLTRDGESWKIRAIHWSSHSRTASR